MEGLREAAVRLAAEQLCWASYAREICESGSHNQSTTGLVSREEGGTSVAATEEVWEAVKCCWEDRSHLLSSAHRCKLASVLQGASGLQDTLLFCPQNFLQCLIKQLPSVPLEVVCSLHTASLITMESFLKESGASIQYMVGAVTSLSCQENVSDAQRAVMQTVAEAMCELVTNQCPEALEGVNQLPRALQAPPTYSLLRAAKECPCGAAEEVGAVMLSHTLDHPPLPVLEAVPQQSHWQISSLPQHIISLYSDLLAVLTNTHFLQLLQKAISVEQLNWPAMFQSVACFLHHDESTPTLLKDMVEGLVSGGLEEEDTHLLLCGLLIARQASLEGPHLFLPYGQWLQNMFGDRSGTFVRGKKELLFLLKTLSSLVPYDPVFVLKAHVSHPPRQLPKCLTQVNAYVTLVSTRLQDLGEKVPSGEKTDVDASREVEEAIKTYRCTGCIPQSVMEASRFRQPYYLGRFLPSLLSRSSAASEDEERFISALAREKIIPTRMMRKYEKACREMKGREVEGWTGDAILVVDELPDAVRGKEGGVTKLLSRLSSCLRKEESHTAVRAVKLVDHILSAIGKTVVTEWEDKDRGYRWVGDLLAVLCSHTCLHTPLYLRITELLTSQFVQLAPGQLFAIAVLLCQAFVRAPPMAGLRTVGKTGNDFCCELLSQIRHDSPSQALWFGCMFMELHSGTDGETTLPACLLHKMVYMHRREKFLHRNKPCPPESDVLGVIERLLQENNGIAEQWHSCKISFEEWVSWELELGEEETSQSSRQSYRWREVYGTYFPSLSADQLFQTLFKALVLRGHSADFQTILQELARVGTGVSPSPLLEILQKLLCDDCSRLLAASSMLLAVSLPPASLFSDCSGRDVRVVASFLQETVAPLVVDMMILPCHITHYLLQGVCGIGESAVRQLCQLSPFFLASLMVQWPLFPDKCHCSHEVVASASWIHSDMQGPLPVFLGPALLPPLSVAIWHKWSEQDNSVSLAHLPSQAIVLVAACCVHWLGNHAHPHPLLSTLESLLETCIELEPTAVEVFLTDKSVAPDYVKLHHLQLLTGFRRAFSCNPSSFYPLLLLKLAGTLSEPLLRSVLAATPSFLWLCVRAHQQTVSLSAPLPDIPPLVYQPLSVDVVQDSKATLMKLIEKADSSQLQNVLRQCPSELKLIIMSKLNTW